jgi:hypothetical protein
MLHSAGLRVALSGAAEAAAPAGQEVALELDVVQLREAGEELTPPRPLGRWPIRTRTAAVGLEELEPAAIDVITDAAPGGHPCNEGFLLRLRHGGQLLLEFEFRDAQSGARTRGVSGEGWREVRGERLVTLVGPPGLTLSCEGLHILID